MTETQNKTIIKSVQKSLQLLKIIIASEGEISLVELEKLLGFNTSTIHHILRTLLEEGFVSQNKENKKYDVGPELVLPWIGHRSLEKYFYRAEGIIENCAKITEETTNLFIRENDEMLCIAGYESNQTIKAYLVIGRRVPLACTAVGKVYLSYMKKEEVKSIIQRVGLKKYMDNTITDYKELLKVLQKINIQGYATELDEYEEMITALSVPVFNSNGEVICAISSIMPSYRADDKKIKLVIDTLRSSAEEISKILGQPYY